MELNIHVMDSYSNRRTGSNFTKQQRNRLRMQTGCANVSAINRPMFCCLHFSLEQQPAGLKQTGLVVNPAVKFKMCIIHRIINFCITATLKTGGAYYTQVRIISETLQQMSENCQCWTVHRLDDLPVIKH